MSFYNPIVYVMPISFIRLNLFIKQFYRNLLYLNKKRKILKVVNDIQSLALNYFDYKF
jgi:hypothetical protein